MVKHYNRLSHRCNYVTKVMNEFATLKFLAQFTTACFCASSEVCIYVDIYNDKVRKQVAGSLFSMFGEVHATQPATD